MHHNRTQNSEIVYLTLKLQNNKSNNYIPIWGLETCIQTKRIVTIKDANHTTLWCLDHLTFQNIIIVKLYYKI